MDTKKTPPFCGARSEAPDGTPLVCALPKGHPPCDSGGMRIGGHQGWYEGTKCFFDADIGDTGVALTSSPHFVTGAQKRDRAQAVLLAAADRRVEDVARALVKLTEGFRELDFQQLEDFIPPEVWDGLVQAMAEYRRKEFVGR